ADVIDIILQTDIAMREALQLLESDSAGPQQINGASFAADSGLRQIARFRRPFGMLRAGIVPIHQDRAVTGIEIEAHKARRISLLVDQREFGGMTQQAVINLIADFQIFLRHARRHQRADHLCVTGTDQLDFAACDQSTGAANPFRIKTRDFLQRKAGDLDADGTLVRRQIQQRPVAALDHLAALLFLDRGERNVEMEEREQMQGRVDLGIALLERRIHAVSIRICASASFAASSAASRVAPMASTMAADGRLSPAGGMISPSFAVTTTSAMPAILRASSAPETFTTLPG